MFQLNKEKIFLFGPQLVGLCFCDKIVSGKNNTHTITQTLHKDF